MARSGPSASEGTHGQAEPERLSRGRIIDAARELVDEGGLETLSMRRLAQELDVWPMSVYRYFRDKEELLDAVVDHATEGVGPPDSDASWRAQLSELLGEARRALGQRPSDLAGRLTRAMLTPGVLRLTDTGVGILERAGFDAREAVSAWRALCAYTFGFMDAEPGVAPAAAARQVRAAIAALPEEDLPVLSGRPDDLAAAMTSEDEFDYGLERLLDGLEARLGYEVANRRRLREP